MSLPLCTYVFDSPWSLWSSLQNIILLTIKHIMIVRGMKFKKYYFLHEMLRLYWKKNSPLETEKEKLLLSYQVYVRLYPGAYDAWNIWEKERERERERERHCYVSVTSGNIGVVRKQFDVIDTKWYKVWLFSSRFCLINKENLSTHIYSFIWDH